MRTVRLVDRATFQISGEDSEHFLENLVTCRVAGLPARSASFGALLTPQGKILFDFFLLVKKQDYLVDVHASLAEDFAKRLNFYKLRAKVEISKPAQTPVLACWDCKRPDAGSTLADPRHTDMGFRVYDFETDLGTDGDYDAHRTTLGVPQGGIDFVYSAAFPHEALMDQFGGIDFKKGCYVGQEVVSRMQHRSTARKRVVKVAADTPLPKPGTPILANSKPAGTLGTVDGNRGLALLRLDRIADADRVEADGICLSVSLPDWVTFKMPERTL